MERWEPEGTKVWKFFMGRISWHFKKVEKDVSENQARINIIILTKNVWKKGILTEEGGYHPRFAHNTDLKMMSFF